MIRKNLLIRICAIAAALSVSASLAPLTAEASFTPPFTTLRIGLFFGPSALPSANLQNVEGFGRGFDFGYFDSGRAFVPIGAWTDESRITMMMDRNMVWNPGTGTVAGEYREGTSGAASVGAFHVQLDAGYGTFQEARAIADEHSGGFVRYENGTFLVLIGHYTSRTAAETAMASLGAPGAMVNAGTSNTVTVVRTGSDTILFEFEHGSSRSLGVMPRAAGSENPETWFRGFRYNGGFQYSRRDGALITVTHFVNIEDYVKGILPYEMNNAWPIEALKAQALCARTYAMSYLNRHNTNGFDLCVEEHCQVYRGRNAANARTDQAVMETAGMYITYDGELTQTYYASTNGGASENSENVWIDALPYLRGVIDPYEANIAHRITNPSYHWTITYTPAQITQRLLERGYNVSTIVSMQVSQYTPTGNVLSVTVTDANGRRFTFSRRAQLITALGVPTQRFNIGGAAWDGGGGVFANAPAQAIGPNNSVSAIDGGGNISEVPTDSIYAVTGSGSAEIVTGEPGGSTGGNSTGLVNGVFTIRGSGRGHNVGMSQWGAYSMAHYHGLTFEDIIHFYFTGVEITGTA